MPYYLTSGAASAVIACQCLAVSDRTVLGAVAEGAQTIADIGAVCGAGTECGGCHRTLERMIDAAVAVDTVFEGSRVRVESEVSIRR